MADRMSKMDRSNRIYAAIDLKSFYASVEVVESKTGSVDDASCRRGPEPDIENDLPCGIAFFKGVWDSRTRAPL